MELDKAIQKRHSVRKFSNKKPDWRKIIECIDAMRYAPMAGNNCTLKILFVDDEEKIKKIGDATQQEHVSEAKCLVVVCSKIARASNMYGEPAKEWARQQAGAAIENFLLKIEEAGLATCWVGYFDEEEIKRELHIPNDVYVEAVLPVGLEYKKPLTKKAKIDLDNILYFNNYNNKKMKKPFRAD